MPFNFSSPEYLSHHRTQKNRVSPVSRASPAHMNSPLEVGFQGLPTQGRFYRPVYSLIEIVIKTSSYALENAVCSSRRNQEAQECQGFDRGQKNIAC